MIALSEIDRKVLVNPVAKSLSSLIELSTLKSSSISTTESWSRLIDVPSRVIPSDAFALFCSDSLLISNVSRSTASLKFKVSKPESTSNVKESSIGATESAMTSVASRADVFEISSVEKSRVSINVSSGNEMYVLSVTARLSVDFKSFKSFSVSSNITMLVLLTSTVPPASTIETSDVSIVF